MARLFGFYPKFITTKTIFAKNAANGNLKLIEGGLDAAITSSEGTLLPSVLLTFELVRLMAGSTSVGEGSDNIPLPMPNQNDEEGVHLYERAIRGDRAAALTYKNRLEGLSKDGISGNINRNAIDSLKSIVIKTPNGDAVQSLTKEAIEARIQMTQEGVKIYRIGMKGFSNTGQGAQFWSLENPLTTPDFGKKYGIPENNIKKIDFIETATIKKDATFITRPAPTVGNNPGGGIEIVVPSDSNVLIIESHVTL